MTLAQKLAIVTPATGLLVYQTDGAYGFWYYNGSAWIPFLSGTDGWRILGNAGTAAGTNFIGTTDAIDFVTKTNGAERMRILSGGNIGIGTTTPGSALDIKGTLRLSGSTSGYVGLQPAAVAGSTTYTLPSADGTGGQQLTTNGSGSLSWSNQTGTTTNTLSLSINTLTSTVNGVAATSSAVGSVGNTSSANTLSTTVNGVVGSTVNIINTNATSLVGTNLTTTVNGVASTALDLSPAITSKAWSLTGNAGTVAGTNFIGTTDAIDFVAKTNNTEKMRITSAGLVGIGTAAPTAGSLVDVKGSLYLTNGGAASEIRLYEQSGSGTNYSGFKAQAQAGNVMYILPAADGTAGQQLSTNGAGTLSWSNQTGATTNTLSLATNTLTSTVNGVAATSNAVSGVSNTSAANTLSTTVNGVVGSTISIINTNATSLAGANLTTTVNGVASTALDLTPAIISKAWSLTGNAGTVAGTNFIGTTDAIDFVTKTNGTERMRVLSAGNIGIGTTTPGSALDIKGTLRLSGSASGYVGLQPAAAAGSTTYTLPSADGTSGQQLSTNGAGILNWTNQTGATTNTLSLATNTLTSTVNGVSATSNAVSGVSNTSAVNTLSTTVNGVAGSTVNIINSNAISLSGANLTTTVNGVASTALDLTPAITSKAWSLTGNAGTVAGTNFVGTTDAIDFVTKTNNTEKMRVTSAGNVGIGTTAPGQKLETMNGNIFINNNNNISGELIIAEPSTSGTNITTIKAQAQAADITYSLPATQGVSNSYLQNDGSGNLSWGNGATGSVSFIQKTADESVTNSSILQDDDFFIFTLAANRTYTISALINASCSNVGGIDVKFVAPAGSSEFMYSFVNKSGSDEITYITSPITTYQIASSTVIAGTNVIVISGTVTTAGTGGTFKMQWAQNTADGTPSTFYSGSYMTVTIAQ